LKSAAYIDRRSATSSTRPSAPSSAGLDQRSRPRKLIVRDRLIDKPLKLVKEGALARLRVAVRPDRDPAAEEARAIDEWQPEGHHVLSDLALAYEPAIEA